MTTPVIELDARFSVWYMVWRSLLIHLASCKHFWNQIPRHTPFIPGSKIKKLVFFSFVRQENLFVLSFVFLQTMCGLVLGSWLLFVFGLFFLCLTFWANFYNAIKRDENQLAKMKAAWVNLQHQHKEGSNIREVADAMTEELNRLYPFFK